MAINRVSISGNLTREPVLRMTASQTGVLNFTVAVNDRRKNPQTGEWEDYPDFVDCTVFGARAEGLNRYLHKGTKVAIDGKLRYSTWEKDDEHRSKLSVIVNEIEFMSRDHADDSDAGTPDATGHTPAPDLYDEDIPF